MRFELIDQVVERTDEKIVAIKQVSAAEEYLADHFPSFPVLPGVMMLETMVQAGRLLAAGEDTDPRACDGGRPLMIEQVRNVRYGNMVRPGQALRVEVSIRKRDGDAIDMDGVGKVGDAVAVQGRFRLTPDDKLTDE